MRKMHEQVIDDSSSDEVIETSDSADATDRARHTVESWEQFRGGQHLVRPGLLSWRRPGRRLVERGTALHRPRGCIDS